MQQRSVNAAALRSLGGRCVRVRLDDGSEFVGTFRIELLSEHSISAFLQVPRIGSEGVTIYLDSIVEIAPVV